MIIANWARLQKWLVAAAAAMLLGGPLPAADVRAELPPHARMLEVFDTVALNAQNTQVGVTRKWTGPIRYRTDGMLYDKTRIATAIAAVEKLGQLAGVPVAPAAEGEPENYLLMFRNVAYLTVPGFGKASCVAYLRSPEQQGFAITHVRLEINLADDPDISRCIYHEGVHGLGLLGHPERVDSVLNYATRNRVEPSELDLLLIRVLYDPRMKPGMGRLPALLTAHQILAEMRPTGADLPAAYLDGIVAALTKAADQGSRLAQRQLDEAYRHGLHVAVDAAVAERWHTLWSQPVPPPSAGAIPLDDPRQLPFVFGGSVYEGYKTFLSRTTRPRAFAVSSSGSWGWYAGRSNAAERALATCQQNNLAPCMLYAVDDAVVWKPSAVGPYGDEDADWGVIGTDRPQAADKLHAPTPRQHPNAPRVTTDQLIQMLQSNRKPVLLDAAGGTHWSLPGAYRLFVMEGLDLAEQQKASLRQTVEELRGHDASRPLVVFCTSAYCWISYNMILRLQELGGENIHWYRGGIAAWRAAGQNVAWPTTVEPF